MARATSNPHAPTRGWSGELFARALQRALPIGLLVGALLLYVSVLVRAGHEDLHTYLAAGADLRAGHPLYATFLRHPFPDVTLRPAYIYPPAFAMLMLPFTWLEATLAAWAWLALMQAALTLSMLLVYRFARPRWSATWVALLLTLTFFPLLVDVAQGQANLLVLALVTTGVIGILQGSPQAGALAGAAGALKLTPLILIGWLLWTHRWRAAAFVLLGFAATTGAGALVRPQDTVTFYGQVLPALAGGTAFYHNQSLAAVLDRVLTTNPYTSPWLALPFAGAIVIVVGVALLGAWAWTARQLPANAAAWSFVPLLPLLSAVTWEHHLVVLLPVIWLAVTSIQSRGWPMRETALLGAAIACLSVLSRWHPGPGFGTAGFRAAQTGDPLVVLSSNALFLGTLILFLGSRWLLQSR